MPAWLAPAIIGASSLAGSLLSGFMGKKSSNRAASIQEDELELKRWLLTRQMEEYEKQKSDFRTTAERRFNVQRSDWQKRERFVNALQNMYRGRMTDPARDPMYRAFSDASVGRARTSASQMAGALRRRGRTGGVQDKVLSDINLRLEQSLNDKLLQIQNEAEEKRVQAEGLRSPQPFMDLTGGPTLSGINYAPSGAMSPWSPNVDMSGMGSAFALALKNYYDTRDEEKDTTVNKIYTSAGDWGSINDEIGVDDSYW